MLTRLRLANFLSFRDARMEFGPLTVLIGPNASGKSNLVTALRFLAKVPGDLDSWVANRRGMDSWLKNPTTYAWLRASFLGDSVQHQYTIAFQSQSNRLLLREEELLVGPEESAKPYLHDSALKSTRHESLLAGIDSPLIPQSEEIVAWRRLRALLVSIGVYDLPRPEIYLGTTSAVSADRLDHSLGNLLMVFQDMQTLTSGAAEVNHFLHRVYHEFEKATAHVDRGMVHLWIKERFRSEPFHAQFASRGTLNLFAILVVLFAPVSVTGHFVCLEEPETGLHPDAVRVLAYAIDEASQQKQVFVTTHSRPLVNALSHRPECLRVIEKIDGQSEIFQPNPSELNMWLKEYDGSLGAAWESGAIGGN